MGGPSGKTRESLTKRPGKERLHEAGCCRCAEDRGLLADSRQARSWTNGQVAPVQQATTSLGDPPASGAVLRMAHDGAKVGGKAQFLALCPPAGGLPQAPGGLPPALEALPPPEVVPVLPAGLHRSPSQQQLSPEWARFLPQPPDWAWSGLPGAERPCLPVSVLPSSGGSLDPRPLGRS